MTVNIPVETPAAVRDYLEAMNALDGDGIVRTFARDALVNDAQREFRGSESISRWVEKEIIADKVVASKIVSATPHHGDFHVVAEFDGDFDKTGLPDPLVLTLYFSLHGGQISRLIILHTRRGY